MNTNNMLIKSGTVAFNTSDIENGIVICTVPLGTVVTRVVVDVTEAFNATTANVFTVGTKTAKNEILGSGKVDANAIGVNSEHTFYKMGAKTEIYAKFTQTGTAATKGIADVYLEVAILPSV